MQVPSITPEIITDPIAPIDNITLPNSTPSDAGFAAIILAAEAKPDKTNALLPNTQPVLKLDPQEDEDETAVPLVNPLAINLLISQIDLLTKMDNPNKPVQVEVDPNAAPVKTGVPTIQVANRANYLNKLSSNTTLPTPIESTDATEKAIDENGLMIVANAPLLDEKTSKQPEKVTAEKAQAAPIKSINTQHVALPVNNSAPAAELLPIKKNENGENFQNNKHVNALLQMGEFINSHTAKLTGTTHAPSEIADTNYIATAKKVASGNYETKIDLRPETIDSILKNTYNANIKIYPPELGHVLAKLKIDKNNAELVIMTESSVVKQIVEANLPQLRENFQQADINLSSIQVLTSQSNGKSPENNSNSQSNQPVTELNTGLSAESTTSPEKTATQLNSLVDTYA
jgi:flagellar hook-length control protein FliK